MIQIRNSILSDLPQIVDIYNWSILHSTATFDTAIKTTLEQLPWFEKHGGNYPILVAIKVEPGKISRETPTIVGWASLSQWSDRCAYSETAEFSVYIAEEFQGKGFGRKLMSAIDQLVPSLEIHSLISRITEGNDVSIHLHEALGFRHIGVMKEVGVKFGRRLDVVLMQKIYPEG